MKGAKGIGSLPWADHGREIRMVKKIEKKKRMIIFLCLLVLLAGIVVMFFMGKERQPEGEEEITLKEGQSFLYGQIAAVYGNEITCYLVEMEEEEENNLKETKEVSKISNNRKEEGAEEEAEGMPGFGEGKRKEKKSVEEEKTIRREEEGGERTEEMPDFEGGKPPMMSEGEMPDFEGGKPPMAWEGGRPDFQGGKMPAGRVVTEEKFTVQIPVGTQVTTRLGNITTFSRLAAGDHIRMLVQEEDGKQVILKIWIIDET